MFFQISGFSNEAIAGWVVAAGLTLLNYKIKLDVRGAIDSAIDDLRKEFGGTFLPAPLGDHRITSLESEFRVMRETRHKETQEMTKQFLTEYHAITEQFFSINEALRDQARRISAVETKSQTNDGMLHDHQNRIREIERHRS